MTKIEKTTFIFLGISFFVGMWHALPMLNIINDEMYFVGGVLRAMENYSILPQIDDVPYGTLTYFMNYLLMTPFLAALYLFFGFNIGSVKDFLIQSPQVAYIVPRFASALLALGLLYLINKFLQGEFKDTRIRLLLLLLIFTNFITTLILHTGKMWVLSQSLVLVSFLCLYMVIKRGADFTNKNRYVFLSIIFAFLAFSNFPLNFYVLVTIPILIFHFRNNKRAQIKVIQYSFLGLVAFAFITFLNLGAIKNQIIGIFISYHPVQTEGIFNLKGVHSLFLNLIKTFALFPLIILAIFLNVRNGIRSKPLFFISILYFSIYFVTLGFLATWTLSFQSFLRYLFPLGFYLFFILASLDIKTAKSLYAAAAVSVVYFLFTLYYLSVPTTYNQVYDWVNENVNRNDVVVMNNVYELQLPKNKQSYLLTKKEFCASKCINVIENDLNAKTLFRVIDKQSEEIGSLQTGEVYYVEDNKTSLDGRELIKEFTNKIQDQYYYSVDYNMGNYFDLKYFRIKNLGKTYMYIEKYN